MNSQLECTRNFISDLLCGRKDNAHTHLTHMLRQYGWSNWAVQLETLLKNLDGAENWVTDFIDACRNDITDPFFIVVLGFYGDRVTRSNSDYSGILNAVRGVIAHAGILTYLGCMLGRTDS